MSEEASPYTPPQSQSLEIDADTLEGRKATRGRRFANFVLDTVGYLIVAIIITFIWAAADPAILDSPMFDIVMGYPLYLGYYALFEGFMGRTPAKLITGTRVVDDEGNKPGFGKTTLRSLARFIPFEPLSFFRDSGEGWHDTLTRTHVIRNKPPTEIA